MTVEWPVAQLVEHPTCNRKGHGFESCSGPMCFSPVLVQNTLSFTIYWGIDGNSQYFNFGSISIIS